MIYNKLGNTDIKLSAIGLGTWAIGGAYEYGWGHQDEQESIATIRRAIDLGINWLDTAPIYGLGNSENVVAKAIEGLGEKVIVSTKCGLCWDGNKKIFNSLKEDSIRSEVEASLKRLKRDVIDLYMIHKPVPDEDIEEAWALLTALVKEGKIRYAGVSSFTLEQLERVHAVHPVAFAELEYHMLERYIEDDVLAFCARNKIGLFNFSSMCRGLLTGKFTREKYDALPDDDFRKTADPQFKEPYFTHNLQLIEKLRPIAERNNKTLAQLSIAWVLRHPEMNAAIVGARRPSQIEQTAPAGDWVLSAEDRLKLDAILDEHHAHLKKITEESTDS